MARPPRAPRADRSPWQRALDLLERRALCGTELATRLVRAGVAPGDAETAVARAVELKLVDDRAVAYNHASRRVAEGRFGPRRVRAEMLARGLPAGLVDEALAEAFGDQGAVEAARRALARVARGGVATREERDRAARRLLRAGFSGSVVQQVLRLPAIEDDDDAFE